MAKLFLLRHLKSQWNADNRFSGWVDVSLDKNETEVARGLAGKIFQSKIDCVFSSSLIRNLQTVLEIFENGGKYPLFIHLDKGKMKDWGNFEKIPNENYIPVYVSENLNERYYGKLQGVEKNEAMQKYGEEKVRLWRRSYDIAPPGGESLKNVVKRTEPFYKKYVEKELGDGKNVLIVASHNSLRAIVKYIEKISDDDIINFEIPFAGLLEYEFDEALKIKNKISR